MGCSTVLTIIKKEIMYVMKNRNLRFGSLIIVVLCLFVISTLYKLLNLCSKLNNINKNLSK